MARRKRGKQTPTNAECRRYFFSQVKYGIKSKTCVTVKCVRVFFRGGGEEAPLEGVLIQWRRRVSGSPPCSPLYHPIYGPYACVCGMFTFGLF